MTDARDAPDPSPPEAPARSWRGAAAWAVAGVGLAVLAVLLARQTPVFGPPALDLGPTSIAVLDTVTLAGRTVRAQLDAVVESVETDGTVWVSARGREFPVALGTADTAGVRPERRLLLVGRLRGADGRRWLDAGAWTLVEGVAVAPAADSARFGPPVDTLETASAARFAPAVDRSGAPSDRSAATR